MDWKKFIDREKSEPYFKKLIEFLLEDGKSHTIYPKHTDVFNAFKYTPLNQIKVVIVGQDCYIHEGQAHGLAFSVPDGVAIPPSLRNIFQELEACYLDYERPKSGNLTAWAKQDVLLLNSVMTVRAGNSGSHKNSGWMTFTDRAIELVNQQDRSIVYLLWGAFAKSKKELITNPKHLVLEAAHPSPYSVSGFFGCGHFVEANDFLHERDIPEIEWRL